MLHYIIVLLPSLGILMIGLFCFFCFWVMKVLQLDILELAKVHGDQTGFNSIVLESFRRQVALLKWRVARLIEKVQVDNFTEKNKAFITSIITDEKSLISYSTGQLLVVLNQEGVYDLEENDINKLTKKISVDLSTESELKKEARSLYWIGYVIQHTLHPVNPLIAEVENLTFG